MFLDQPVKQYSQEELADRAEQAKRYLRDPFFNSVMDEAEAEVIAEWLQNTDEEARKRCWLLAKGLETVMRTLRGIVDAGPMVDKIETGA